MNLAYLNVMTLYTIRNYLKSNINIREDNEVLIEMLREVTLEIDKRK